MRCKKCCKRRDRGIYSIWGGRSLYCLQSEVHENGVCYTMRMRFVGENRDPGTHEVCRKYTKVSARGTPVYFRGNLAENSGEKFVLLTECGP